MSNAIQTFNAVMFYTDRSRSARFLFSEINRAVTDAIMKHIDSVTDTDNNPINGIDRLQVYKDELWTLIKSSTGAPSSVGTYNSDVRIFHYNYPTDYQTFGQADVTIAGTTTYIRDVMSYNSKGPQLDCSFRKPTNKKPYFVQDATGFTIYVGPSGTFSNVNLTYIKEPNNFYMGNEANLIDEGTGVLTINTAYIAFEDSTYNGTLYPSGTVFTTNGALTDLASGQVILSSLLVPIDLPNKTHDTIAKMAAEILLGVTEKFDSSAYVEKESK